MLLFRPDVPSNNILRVLCLGAHCDDIEIGCGGTILKMIENGQSIDVRWVVFCSNDLRAKEATNGANAFLNGAKKSSITVRNGRDGFLPYTAAEVKDYFEELKKEPEPDIIFTHYRDDRHQDHRLISDLTWNTWRSHFILEYEIPKYDGDLGTPNAFVQLSKSLSTRKADTIIEHYGSQRNKHWFSRDTFLALARLRGMECTSKEGFAEAFYCRKMLL